MQRKDKISENAKQLVHVLKHSILFIAVGGKKNG
jgi:hypothetical protein